MVTLESILTIRFVTNQKKKLSNNAGIRAPRGTDRR